MSQLLAEIEETPLRGEVVIVLAGAESSADLPGAIEEARKLMAEGLTKAKAAAKAAASHGVPRREVYEEILKD